MRGFGDWADLAIQSRPRGASNYHISSQLWDGTTKPNATTSYTSNGLNQYTAITGIGQSSIPPTHDANGNLTAASHWQYSYDSDNRLKTATSTDLATAITASLTYDAQGRLRQTQINIGGGASNNKTSQLLYDGVDLIAEYDTSTNSLQRRYVHGPGVDEPLVWYEGPGITAKNWLYADHLGSIIATANASGSASAGSGTVNTYGPFGESAQTTLDNNRFGYTGQQHLLGLGLYYYKARIYSPALGRFLQTDPIGVADDLNLYSYVGNGAVNLNDPSGMVAGWLKESTLAGGNAIDDLLFGGYAQRSSQAFGAGNLGEGLLNFGAGLAFGGMNLLTLGQGTLMSGAASVTAPTVGRGLSAYGGTFSSTTNAVGGDVVTSVGRISQNDFATTVNSGLYKGNVKIISGVHGTPSGATIPALDLFKADVARFGSILGVQVYNFPAMTPGQLTNLLRGPGTTIGGFCDSGACLAPFR